MPPNSEPIKGLWSVLRVYRESTAIWNH